MRRYAFLFDSRTQEYVVIYREDDFDKYYVYQGDVRDESTARDIANAMNKYEES